MRCESLGPGLLNNTHLARLWDKVALTDDETQAVEALKLIYGDRVQRVTVIGDDSRRVVVKIVGQERPVPLKSLGDGAVRLFGVALALANSQGGFLLIDEVENGIHHSIQPDFWKMVLKTAQMNKVQVLATTHGWDCVAGFARAAMDLDEVEGILVRLEQDGEKIRAIEYSEKDLNIAAEQGIEVR
jgi:predicted ATPase